MSRAANCSTPGDWTLTTLGAVSECTLGGTPSTDVPEYWNGEIPWMASGDVNLRRVHAVAGRITRAGLAASNATLISPPAVAVGLAGQGKTRGTVALTLCTVCTNQSIAMLKGNSSSLQTEFLFHNLDHRYEELRARSSGGGRGGLSKGILDVVPIKLPPLPEQYCISQILDTLDVAIGQTEAIIEKLKLVKQGLLHDLLTRGIDANGELRPPQNQAPHLYKDSPLGWLPREWDVKFGREVCKSIGVGIVVKPTQYYRESGIPVLRSANVREHGLTMESLVFMSPADHENQSKSAVRPGDVLTVRTGYPGTSCVVDDQVVEANCVDIIISRPSPKIAADFWCMWINSSFGKEQVLKVQGGLAQQHFNVGELAAMVVATPSMEEQVKIVSRIAAINARLRSEQSSIAALNELKAGLMEDLLTGCVRVTPLLATVSA